MPLTKGKASKSGRDNEPLSGECTEFKVSVGHIGTSVDPPRSQASSRGETKDFSLFSSRDGYFLEPTEWTKGPFKPFYFQHVTLLEDSEHLRTTH